MRPDARPAASRATGPPPSAPASSSPSPPSSSSPTQSAASTSTKTTTSRNREDATLRRSVTALDGGSPRGGERTPAAHSTAFERSPSGRRSRYSRRLKPRCPRPILFVLYLIALLLRTPGGTYLALAAAEATGSASSTDDNNNNDNNNNNNNNRNNQNNNQNDNNRGVAVTRHPYNEYTWELNQINPWLSACDLAGPAPADLQGSCGPPEVPKNCPGPCTELRGRNRDGPGHFDDVIAMLERIGKAIGNEIPRSKRSAGSSSSSNAVTATRKDTATAAGRGRRDTKKTAAAAPEQCLFYLEESHKRDVCREDFGRSGTLRFSSPRENRYWFVAGLRLRHCCEHAAVNALAPGKDGPLEAVLNGGEGCVRALDKLLLVDALAARLHCEFEEVLGRYDCTQSYSIVHNCTHCKEAYRKWVCSSLVPYFAHGGPHYSEPSEESWTGRRIRPCRSLCQSVEQRCPYLLPGDRAPAYPTQYAGEPTFLCQDPNIPETGEQAARAIHSIAEEECCFNVCSEEEPVLGICANCTDRVTYVGPTHRDPPTAPQCETLVQPPMRSQSSYCSGGGFGSMVPNSYFDETSASPLPPDSTTFASTTASTTSTTSSSTASSSASSSSAANLASSSVPLLCLFWLWGVLFSSQCSMRRVLGLVGLAARCLRAVRVSHARVLLALLLLALPLPTWSRQRRSRGRRARRRRARSRRCQASQSSTDRTIVVATRTASASGTDVAVVAERPRRPRRGRHCHCCCSCPYRWWLWPGRWKATSDLSRLPYRGHGAASVVASATAEAHRRGSRGAAVTAGAATGAGCGRAGGRVAGDGAAPATGSGR